MTLAAGRALAIGLRRAFHVVDGWVSYSADGVIVVATANRGRDLEPALRRRFNVIAEYCRRRTALAEAIALAVGQCEGFTFAELAAAYTTAGTRAYERGGDISVDGPTDAPATVRRAAHADARGAGRVRRITKWKYLAKGDGG